MNAAVIKFRILMGLATLGIFILTTAVLVGVVSLYYGISAGVSIITGMVIFVMVLDIIQWLIGPYIINATYRATEVKPEDPQYGWLVGLVSEVAMENRISVPKVYLANAPFPNAFAYGSPLAGKRVAITYPLLRILSPQEIKAVLGHELGHLKHRDVELLMAVGLIPAVMYWLGYSLFWGGMFGGGGERNNNGGNLFIVGIILIALSSIFQFFVLYINRLREAYADVNSAITVPGGAENLQTALAKLSAYMDPRLAEKAKRGASSLTNMLFFTPLEQVDIPEADVHSIVEYWKTQRVPWYADFFSDHPHPAKRIQLLEKLKRGY